MLDKILDKLKAVKDINEVRMRLLIARKDAYKEAEFYYNMLELHDDVKEVLYELRKLPEEERQRMEFQSLHKSLQEILHKCYKELCKLS